MTAPGDNRLAVLAGEIQAAHRDVTAGALTIARRAIDAGTALIDAKAALPHGAWDMWLTANVQMSSRTARRYMQLAKSGIKSATVAVLGVRGASEAIAKRDEAQQLAFLDDPQGWPLPTTATEWLDIKSRDDDAAFAIVWRNPESAAGFFDFIAMGHQTADGGAEALSCQSATRAFGFVRYLKEAGFDAQTAICTRYPGPMSAGMCAFISDFKVQSGCNRGWGGQVNAQTPNTPETITLATLEPMPTWVAWQTEDRPDGKPTKVPYAPDGRKARANAPSTWGTRAQAEAMAVKLPKPYGAGGVGIEFHHFPDGRSCGGIDLDSCRDPQTGHLEEWALDVVKSFQSYTENSPSATGVKIFFLYTTADMPLLRAAMGGAAYGKQFKRGNGKDHPPAIELHLGNRYFAVTDQSLTAWFQEFRHVDTSLLLELITVIGPAFSKVGPESAEADDNSTDAGAKDDHPQRDKSTGGRRDRSAAAFRKGKDLRRAGANFDQMCEALRADPETADWCREKGEANGQREFRRIWEKAEPKGALIRILAGELHVATTAAEDALLASRLPIYQRGDALVQPISREVPASRGRMTLAAGLDELTVFSTVDHLCAVAEWQKFDARSEDWVRINPPNQVAQIMLSRNGRWRFPSIAGVITTPTLRPDGTLLTEPGYDAATRLYHVADPTLRLRPSVHAPTRQAADGALRALLELLADFPFVSDVAKAIALSALITPVVRGALNVVPLHAFRANAPGSGKSYLADVSSAISTGRPCPVITAAPDEAETEKRIAGLLLAGFPLISIDNCNGELGGDLLCQAVERPLIRIRRLGASDIIEIESCATIFATGNALRLRGDMTRRTIVSDLDAGVERPELRKFKSDPVAMILADRGTYVSACLVIARAYISAECPSPPASIASFSEWSTLVRGAVMWLGCADPAASMEQAREDDPELGELREMLDAWRTSLRVGNAYTVRQVIEEIDREYRTEHGEHDTFMHAELRDIVMRIAGERGQVNTKRLGRWLTDRKGRIVADHRFVRAAMDAHGGIAKWSVEKAGQP